MKSYLKGIAATILIGLAAYAVITGISHCFYGVGSCWFDFRIGR